MGDLQENLSRLREKLRRLEERSRSGPEPVGSAPGDHPDARDEERPPWEIPAGDDSAFESTLARVRPPEQRNPDERQTERRKEMPIEECLSGIVEHTPLGTHFVVETFYPADAAHGTFALSDLSGLPASLLHPLGAESARESVETWAFLDTETTGLAGGSGTLAFLVGLGTVQAEGFRVRQYFLREPGEERSLLHQLTEDLKAVSTLVTYNGKGYDLPLLETRFRLSRMPVPFEETPHVDLLHACRRLWKLRFESCKLTFLEERVLGYERTDDIPGFLIPTLYANYLRFGQAASLAPVFTHNALDILSLACLTSVVGGVFSDPSRMMARHGAECVGLGRWLLQAGQHDDALKLLRRAIDTNIPEDLLARTLWDIFEIERKQQRFEEAREALEQIVGFQNRLHTRALEALAILCERRFKDVPRALHYARRLEAMQPGEKVGARLERLVKKLRKARQGQPFDWQ